MKIDYLYYYWECKATGTKPVSYRLWLSEQKVIEAFGGNNLFSKVEK